MQTRQVRAKLTQPMGNKRITRYNQLQNIVANKHKQIFNKTNTTALSTQKRMK